jgi:hypothetical protein
MRRREEKYRGMWGKEVAGVVARTTKQRADARRSPGGDGMQ